MADDSSLLDFPFRRENQSTAQSQKSFKAMPICNNKSLELELKCDDCAPGYPYVELCVQFRQSRANEAFKVRYGSNLEKSWLVVGNSRRQ